MTYFVTVNLAASDPCSQSHFSKESTSGHPPWPIYTYNPPAPTPFDACIGPVGEGGIAPGFFATKAQCADFVNNLDPACK